MIKENHFWKKNGDLTQSISITTLDVFFLLGSIFSTIPSIVTNGAFTALNYSGLFACSFYFDQSNKLMNDVVFSFKKQNPVMGIAAFIKMTFVVASLGLILINCCAATLMLVNASKAALTIYAFLRPISLPCLITCIFLDVIYFFIERRTARVSLAQNELADFFSNFAPHTELNHYSQYASFVQGCIDKDTWKHLVSHLHQVQNNQTSQEELYKKVVIANIKIQQNISLSDLTLRFIGEIAMFISMRHPASIIQAACWTVISSYYSGQLLYQKINQFRQRELTSTVTSELKI
ncbi:MAG: hypothetical protein HW387_1462 [Parachlamydiales bacterium]|nr:hypothetical protein [Parachlamydiales bacterium]